MTKTTLLQLSVSDVERLSFDALVRAGANIVAGRSLARAVAAAEAGGIASHGVAYVPTYCEHLRCGKVDGTAIPCSRRLSLGRYWSTLINIKLQSQIGGSNLVKDRESFRDTVEP